MCNLTYKIDRPELNRRIQTYYGLPLNGDRLPLDLKGTIKNFRLPRRVYNRIFQNWEYINIPGIWDIMIYPNTEKMITKHRGYSWDPSNLYQTRQHTSIHRIYIDCRCGRDIPSGRFHQHVCDAR